MKKIWNPAVTLDGYIALPDGDSDWVTEEDGVFFNEYPVAFGKGIKLLEGDNCRLELELIGSKQLPHGVVQNHYKVRKGNK